MAQSWVCPSPFDHWKTTIDRRILIQSAAACTLMAAENSTIAADDHSLHQHGAGAKYHPLIDATGACIAKGEVCLAHCLTLLANGD